MATRKAMIKASVNGTELLIFSSKLLDKTSQCMYAYFLSIASQWPQELNICVVLCSFHQEAD